MPPFVSFFLFLTKGKLSILAQIFPDKGGENIIQKFQVFYENELGMSKYFNNFSDNRKQPQIPAPDIAKSVLLMPALQLQSILQLDQMARHSVFKNLIGSKRSMVASDTTFERVLPMLDLQPINETIRAAYNNVVSRGLSKFHFSSGNKLVLAAVDGSGFGQFFASVVTLIAQATFPLDSHVSETRGNELLCSRATLSRLTDSLGRSWCDILLADGLYPTKEDFKSAKELYGCDLLVKTSEETLNIIRDAKAIFASDNPDIRSTKGFDSQRKVFYEAKSIEGLLWHGLAYPLTVLWVKETKANPKPGENPSEEFFAITTKTGLSPNDLREAAHARWFIENNVFKRLNYFILSKRAHTNNLATIIRLLSLWLIGLALLQLFFSCFQKLNWQDPYSKVRVTVIFLLKQLYISIFASLPSEILAYG